MRLRTLIDGNAIALQSGGVGSGCHGENCGRHGGGKGVDKTHIPKSVTAPAGYEPERYAKQRQDSEKFWRKQATSQVERKRKQEIEGGLMQHTLRNMVEAGQCDPLPAKSKAPAAKPAQPKAVAQPVAAKPQPAPNPMGSPVQPNPLASPMAQPSAQPPISKANPALPTPKSKPVAKGDSKNASPIVQHVSDHMQDPVGATKEGFQDLQEKKLAYDQSKENMQRNLAPVKSIIQHVEQMHDLNHNGIPDEQEMNPDLNPAAQPGMNQSNKFGLDNGMPPQQVRSPGMNVQQRSPAMAPGTAKPTLPGSQQKSGVGSGLNQQKTDQNNRPGLQQKSPTPKPQKKVHVTVAGNASMAARTGFSNLAMAVRAEALRTNNAACLKGVGACSDKVKAGFAKPFPKKSR